MISTFTLPLQYMPLHCLTCPYQTLAIQWPEPVLLPLAWSGHFQVQVPLLLHHSEPLPKLFLLFPANKQHFLHSTEKSLSLETLQKEYIVYISPACCFMWSASYMDMWRTVTLCRLTICKVYPNVFPENNQPINRML